MVEAVGSEALRKICRVVQGDGADFYRLEGNGRRRKSGVIGDELAKCINGLCRAANGCQRVPTDSRGDRQGAVLVSVRWSFSLKFGPWRRERFQLLAFLSRQGEGKRKKENRKGKVIGEDYS